jgi:hypothetical protein
LKIRFIRGKMSGGWIYILINPSLQKNLLNIGKTSTSPEIRASQLSSSGSPAAFHVAYDIKVKDIHLAERLIHDQLSHYRYTSNREFFQLPLKHAIPIVEGIVKKANIFDEERIHAEKYVDLPVSSPRSHNFAENFIF